MYKKCDYLCIIYIFFSSLHILNNTYYRFKSPAKINSIFHYENKSRHDFWLDKLFDFFKARC